MLAEEVSGPELRGMLRLRQAELPTVDVQLKPVPGLRVAELTGTAAGFAPGDIAPVITPLYAELMTRLDRAGIQVTGQPVAYYEDAGDGAVVVHAAAPVAVAPGPTANWRRPAPAPEPAQGTNAFVCSFQVPEFDAAAARVAALGGEVALPKFAVPGKCWHGYFVDTEGNTFGLYEVDESAREEAQIGADGRTSSASTMV